MNSLQKSSEYSTPFKTKEEGGGREREREEKERRGGGGGGGGVLEMMGMMGVGLEEMGLESEFDFQVIEQLVGEMFDPSSSSGSSSGSSSSPSSLCSGSSLSPSVKGKGKGEDVSMKDLVKRVERMEVGCQCRCFIVVICLYFSNIVLLQLLIHPQLTHAHPH